MAPDEMKNLGYAPDQVAADLEASAKSAEKAAKEGKELETVAEPTRK